MQDLRGAGVSNLHHFAFNFDVVDLQEYDVTFKRTCLTILNNQPCDLCSKNENH